MYCLTCDGVHVSTNALRFGGESISLYNTRRNGEAAGEEKRRDGLAVTAGERI